MLLIVRVRIYGAHTACSTGVTDAWRDVAMLMGRQWKERFGDRVDFEYLDLFGPEASRFPHVLAQVSRDNLALPLVTSTTSSFIRVPAAAQPASWRPAPAATRPVQGE